MQRKRHKPTKPQNQARREKTHTNKNNPTTLHIQARKDAHNTIKHKTNNTQAINKK